MENKKIINKAAVELDLCGEKFTIESNQTEAKPVKLKVEKFQSCDFVLVGRKLKYTVKVINECTTDVCDVLFTDTFDICTTYVEGSFTVNGEAKTPEITDHILKFTLEEIKGKETAVITFEVKAEECCCEDKKEVSEKPTIKTIKKGASSVTGTGVISATVYVKFPNDEIVTCIVGGSNNWSAPTPKGLKLKKGDIVSAVQTEAGKDSCEPVYKTVIDD